MPIPSFDIDEILIRIALLPFYRTYKLLEIVYTLKSEFKNHPSYKKTYVLAKIDKTNSIILRPLSGTSPILHEINSDPKEFNLTEKNVGFYVRFFGWAVHGKEGRFLIPQTIYELNLSSGSNLECFNKLQDQYLDLLDFEIKDFEDLEIKRESNMLYRKGILFYNNTVFKVYFKISANNGMVEMVKDTPICENLVYLDELYNSSQLFQLEINKLG